MVVDDDAGPFRLRIFAFVALVLFGALFTRLWYLQGIEAEAFQAEAESLVLRQVFEEAPRGRILDRNGRVIVDNKVVDVVTVDKAVLEEMTEDEQLEMFHRLATAISRSGRLTKLESIVDEVSRVQHGRFDVVPVAVDVDPSLLVYLGERPDAFPGVAVASRTVRSYPFGPLAAHLLGYVGPVTLAELQSANARIDADDPGAKMYQLSDEIGKTGVERVFEDVLRGVPGVRYLEVDNRGEVIRERYEYNSAPIPGADLYLTIDVDLQALTEEQLAEQLAAVRRRDAAPGEPDFVGAAGCAMATDPRNGDLLAMASFPTYDPREFVNGISFAEFELLTSPENYAPILNRCIQGTYAPGSTFKVITGLAAEEAGLLGEDSIIPEANNGSPGRLEDTGTYFYSRCRDDFDAADTCEFGSTYTGRPRTVGLSEAISVSSDVFFYKLAGEGFWQLPQGPEGDEWIQAKAREFGLGAGTGIQLPYERTGAVPDRDYFDLLADQGVFLRDGSQWFPGDTINLSIGQGELLVTPAQLTNAYATIGNGGLLHQINVAHRIVHPEVDGVQPPDTTFGPRVLRDLEIPADQLAQIDEGLRGVLTHPQGTARSVFDGFPNGFWTVAGKTGTAEVNGKADSSLFAAYGPTNQGEPEIAITAVLEESGFGASAAAPLVRSILEPIALDEVPRARTFDEIDRLEFEQISDAAETDEADGGGDE
ncbi:MAG: penicillin-binding protein 2 [Acidimicrobiales bacterium]|nr:MAG: penicillin-binding protein 2 [Acidimicrobiales bacterium]